MAAKKMNLTFDDQMDRLDRIAEVRELPVEDRTDALGPDDEVAVAEVAVHEARPVGGHRGRVLGEPAQRQLEDRVRRAEPVDEGAVLRHLLERTEEVERGEGVEGGGVDAGELLAALFGEAGAGVRVLVVAQDAAGDGLALDAVHDEAGPEVVRVLEEEANGGDGDAGFADGTFDAVVSTFGVMFTPDIVKFFGGSARALREHAYDSDARVFRYGYTQIRMIMFRNRAWFEAAPVCQALGYKDVERSIRHYATTEYCVRGTKKESFLSESGVRRMAEISRHG